MSYAFRSAELSHMACDEMGAGGAVVAPFCPWTMWMRPCPFPAEYSCASTPMRPSRHSSESAPPVEMPMLGISPSLWFFGSVSIRSGSGLSWHCVTFGIVSCRRHLPTWMTIGMFAPSGAF